MGLIAAEAITDELLGSLVMSPEVMANMVAIVENSPRAAEINKFSFRIDKDDAGNPCGFFVGPCGGMYRKRPVYTKRQAFKMMGGSFARRNVPKIELAEIIRIIKACSLPN